MRFNFGGSGGGHRRGRFGRRRDHRYAQDHGADAASMAMRAGILGSSKGSHLPPPPDEERDPDWVDPGLVEYLRPDIRPHPRAQWDDANGNWIIWSEAAGQWVVFDGTSSGAADEV